MGAGCAQPGRCFVEQRTEGLSGDFRLAGHRHPHCRHGGAVSRYQAAIGRPRRVDVGRHPMRTAMDRDRRFVELFPGQIDSPTLNHGHGVLVGRVDRGESSFGERRQNASTTDDQDSGTLAESVDQQVGGGLG